MFRLTSSFGAAPTPAICPDGDPIFISRDQRRVVSISYSFQDDAQRATDLSRAAQHLGADGFAEIVWQAAPQRLALLRMETGDLAFMLHDPAEEVLGWAVHSLAGGKLLSFAVTPAPEGGLDKITIAVERTIAGETVVMIEELSDIYGLLTGQRHPSAANHLFCAHEISAEAQTFSLPQCAGRQVYAWTNAGEFGPLDVDAAGTVSLPAPASAGFIGLFDQTHHAETLDIQAAAPDGDTAGRKRRLVPGVGMSILRTAQGYLSAVERELGSEPRIKERKAIISRQVSSDIRNQVSGVVCVDVGSGVADAVSLRIEPHGGAPMTVLGLVPTIKEGGR